jgi:plastocyanin
MRRLCRHRSLAVVIAAMVLVMAGCAGQSAGSDVPGGPVTGAPPTPVNGQPAGAGVTITALNLEFTPQGVTVPAGQPFTIELVNRDEGIPHDIQVTDPSGAVLVKSEIITGPARLTVQVPALAAGTYTFSCVVHPNMTGTITAE